MGMCLCRPGWAGAGGREELQELRLLWSWDEKRTPRKVLWGLEVTVRLGSCAGEGKRKPWGAGAGPVGMEWEWGLGAWSHFGHSHFTSPGFGL